MDDDEIYCAWEERRFPRDQFEQQPKHGLVHVKGVDEVHTTSGEPLNRRTWALPAYELE
jgi:hypothetical protein